MIKRDSRNNEITANDRPFGVNSPPSPICSRARARVDDARVSLEATTRIHSRRSLRSSLPHALALASRAEIQCVGRLLTRVAVRRAWEPMLGGCTRSETRSYIERAGRDTFLNKLLLRVNFTWERSKTRVSSPFFRNIRSLLSRVLLYVRE